MPKKNILTRSKKKQALTLLQNRRWHEAKALYTQICEIDRTDAEAWSSLAMIHLQLGEHIEAKVSCERVLHLNPNDVEAMLNLGGLYAAEGKFEQAAQYCRRAIQTKPDFAGAHYNLGNALKAQAKYSEAAAAYREALRWQPRYPEALLNLGVSLKEQGCYQEAIACYNRILQINPSAVDALYNLGTAYTSMGQVDDALACLRRSLSLDPGFTLGRSNLLFSLNNSPSITSEEKFAEHRQWGGIINKKYRSASTHENVRDPERRLRIGYVSPDFRGQHSVIYFIESLLANHHRDQVEIYGYAEAAYPDATTERLRALCDHWRITYNQSDEQVAQTIRNDQVDVLVDLAGHTARSRLPVFAFKPAPVQVNYLGYPNTSGLREMDYRLTDDIADPPGLTDRYYTEKLVRLPHGFLCYSPPEDAPESGDLPLEKTGYVTFGSFNSIAKVNPEVIHLWATILNALPGSRLVLKSHALTDAQVRDRFVRLFSEYGVDSSRVQLLGHIRGRSEHMALYRQIDIGLDPFPYNGATTTCEALWMGVPVITLIGEVHAGRVGLSLLSRIGLAGLAARSEEEYRALALALARNPSRIKELRQSLRTRLRESPLCQGQSFAYDVEHAYRAMWRAWCNTYNIDCEQC